MNLREIKELLDLVEQKGYTEFEFERAGTKFRLKRDTPAAASHGPVISYAPVAVPIAPSPVQAALAPAPAAPPAAPAAEESLHVVKSPIVGTFYEASAPGSPPFAKVGDTVTSGQTLCIIEAMKLMNEIESDVAGEVVKCLVSNGQPVEYGQPLFAIRARK